MREPTTVPEGARLVHIGPHKTGTTAVQHAFHDARRALAERDVHYAGTGSQAYRQAVGLTGKRGQLGSPAPKEEDWLALVAEARAVGSGRFVASSESFANAEPEHVRRLASDLGPEAVRVVRMVRRYDKLVASQWQQSVAGGRRQGFIRYVEAVAADPRAGFWRRHGFVPLTQRWAAGVGVDRVSVVIVDEADRGWLLRVFEGLLGLDEGLLVAPAADANRSLTAAEVEVIRVLNHVRVAQQWVARTHYEFVRRGVSVALRELRPDALDGRITTPQTLLGQLRDRSQRDLRDLAALGVDVIGDPTWLEISPADGDEGHEEAPGTLRLESAVNAARAVVERFLAGVSFPLEGSGPEIAGSMRSGRRQSLTSAEEQLVADLEGQPWPGEVVDRFVRRGLVPWLRQCGTGPGPRDVTRADDPCRLHPGRVALGLSGMIAQTDPAAQDPRVRRDTR